MRLGTVSQVQNDGERVICYGSKTMNKAQTRYCTTDRELLAVRYFCKYYKHYLLGRKFLIRTDHRALTWLLSLTNPKSRVARWIEILASYVFEIQYRPSKNHGNADSMSRCRDRWNCSCEELDIDTQKFLACGPCKKCIKRAEDVADSFEDVKIRRCSQIRSWDAYISPFMFFAMFVMFVFIFSFLDFDILPNLLFFLASVLPCSVDYFSGMNFGVLCLAVLDWFWAPKFSATTPSMPVRRAKVLAPQDDGR